MANIKTLCIILLLAASGGAHAVTLDECRRLARDNYPLLKTYGVLEQTERFTLAAARTAWLPQVQLAAQASWQNAVASYPDQLTEMLSARGVEVKGMRKDQYRLGIDIQQAIYDGGRTKAAGAVTSSEADEQRRQADTDMYALEQRVDEVFFGILLLQEQLGAVDASIALLESNLATLQAMLRQGVAMQADVDAVAAELLSARQQRDNIASTDSSFRSVMCLYTGLPSCPQLETPAAAADAATGYRPELALLDARPNTIRSRQRQLDATLRPQLSLFAQGFYGYPGFNSMEAMLNHRWTWNMQVGVRVAWNVSALYSMKSRRGMLNSQWQAIETQRETFLFNQRLQEQTDRGEIDRLQRMTASDNEIVLLRSRVRAAEEAKLREGIINATQLMQKITDEQKAAITAATHKIELLRAQNKLNHTKGR